MTRYGPGHKEATRQRLIDSAGRRFKADGLDGAGIATVVADVGLTNGAFYGHFPSKDDLIASVVAQQLAEQTALVASLPIGRESVEMFIGSTCRQPIATTVPVGARMRRSSTRSAAVGLGSAPPTRRACATSSRPSPVTSTRVITDDAQERAIVLFTLLVGALQTARAVTDRESLRPDPRGRARTRTGDRRTRPTAHRPDRTPHEGLRCHALRPGRALGSAEVSAPTVGPRDVLVEVRASSINPLDMLIRNGDFKQLIPYKRPFILGHDVAGVVLRVGADVSDFTCRRRGLRPSSRPAHRHVCRADRHRHRRRRPQAVEPDLRGGWRGAPCRPCVVAGSRRHRQGPAGAEGPRPCGRGRSRFDGDPGGQAPWRVRRYDRQHEGRGQGPLPRADEVIDYTSQDFSQVLSGYDVVLDSLGKSSLAKSMTVLKPGGLVISVVGPPDAAFATQAGRPLLRPVMALSSRSVRRRAKQLGVRYSFMFMKASGAQLATLAELYDSGVLRPVVDRTFPFRETLEAIAYVEQGKANGKIVITHGF